MTESCTKVSDRRQRIFRTDPYEGIEHGPRMASKKVSPVAKELKRLRKSARPTLTVRDMAKELGYDSHNTYAYYEDGYKKLQLPLDMTRKIADVLEARGVDRADVMALAGVSHDSFIPAVVPPPKIVEVGKEEFVALGRYDVRLSAGPGSLVEDHPQPLGFYLVEMGWLRAITQAAPTWLDVLRVGGDSMKGTLEDGDWVLVDRSQKRISREGIFALRVRDDVWVKRLTINLKDQNIIIISDNPVIPPQPVEEDDLAVIGRVIAIVARRIP